MTQMSDKCPLCKTEKTQISGQTQIIWVGWGLCWQGVWVLGCVFVWVSVWGKITSPHWDDIMSTYWGWVGILHICRWCISIQLLSRLFFILWAVWGPGARRRSRIQNNLQWIRKNKQFKFFQFLMTVNGFFWHGGLGDISMLTAD